MKKESEVVSESVCVCVCVFERERERFIQKQTAGVTSGMHD